jgi:hypothetical protein
MTLTNKVKVMGSVPYKAQDGSRDSMRMKAPKEMASSKGGREGMSDAMKSTKGTPVSGESMNGMSMRDVKIPMGGNMCYEIGDKLPKVRK